MKVLYALVNYPKLSESYVAAEIRYVQTQGVEVHVWAPAIGTKGAPELVPTHRGSLAEAVHRFGPDLIHAHYALDSWVSLLRPAALAGIPVTVRGHSFEFDIAKVNALTACSWVSRVWLFPHFAINFRSEKVRPLPVAFDSTKYVPAGPKQRTMVLRTAAGKPNKGLVDFIDVARRCPLFSFKLVVDRVDNEFDEFVGYLERRAEGSRVEFLKSIPDWAVTQLIQQAGIYLDTADPGGHPFGMPISIAESMATGGWVLARQMPGIEAYMAAAGSKYPSSEVAAVMINGSLKHEPEDWDTIERTAISQAQTFKDVNVLPPLVEDWRQITGKA